LKEVVQTKTPGCGPPTGEEASIPARKAAHFKPAKELQAIEAVKKS
jgi:nucleoid DNA-binding protein